MTGHPRLYRRGATYYHRAAIPIDIKDSYPKSEETFSLNTKNHAEAIKLVRVAAAKIDRKFEAHRRNIDAPAIQELTEQQIKLIGEIYYRHLLEEDEETRWEGFHENGEPIPFEPKPSFEEYGDDIELIDEQNRYSAARGKIDEFYVDEAIEVLTWDNVNLKLASGSPSWQRVGRELQAATIQAAKVKRDRNKGEIIDTPEPLNVPTKKGAQLLSEVVKNWITEKTRTSWVDKTAREHQVWMNNFIEITGDKPLSDYSRADGREFKDVLLLLPANWSKQEDLRGLQICEAAQTARELGISPMAANNYNKLIGFVSSFWSWAENHYDEAPENPLRGLKVKVRKRARDDRDPFTHEELKSIFSLPSIPAAIL